MTETSEHQGQYLELSRLSNAVDYLRKTEMFLKVENDDYAWKWICLCLTDALYGFLIWTLSEIHEHNVIAKKDVGRAKKSLSAIDKQLPEWIRLAILDNIANRKRVNVLSFGVALKTIQSEEYEQQHSLSQRVPIDEDEEKQISKLRKYRDFISHSTESSWCAPNLEIAQLSIPTIKVVKTVLGNFSITAETEHLEEARQLAERVSSLLDERLQELEKLNSTPTSTT